MAEFVFPSKPEHLLEPDCESALRVVTEINVAEMEPEASDHLVEGVGLPLVTSSSSSSSTSYSSLPSPRYPHPPRPQRTLTASHCCGAELCYDICESDPLCISEQRFFDRVFGLIRSAFMADRAHTRSAVARSHHVIPTSGIITQRPARTARRGFAHLQPVPRRRLIDSLVSNLSVLNACVDSALGSDAETLLRHRTALKLYVFFLHWVLAQAEAEARESGGAAPTAPVAKCGSSCDPSSAPCSL